MSTTDTVVPAIARVAEIPTGGRSRLRLSRRATVAATLLMTDLAVALAVGALAPLVGYALAVGAPALPTVAILPMLAAVGLYVGFGPSPPERLRLRALAGLLYAAACLLVAGRAPDLPRLAEIVLLCGLLLVLGFYAELAARRFLIRRGLWGAPTVIVGTDAASRALADHLSSQPELGLQPVGYLGDRAQEALPLPGDLPNLTTIAGAADVPVEVAIFSSCADLARHDLGRVGALPATRLVLAQQIQDLQNMWVQVRPLGSAVGLEIRRELYRRHNLVLKRALDVTLAGLGLLLATPVAAMLAVLIWLRDPGNPVYVQLRVGWNGRPIRVLKLRTMYGDAEQRLREHLDASPEAQAEWQRFFKLAQDPRVLPGIGAFLRRTSLDELPQLWNVVRGDMSLVGPRPFPGYHMEGFEAPFRTLRTSVPPGVTGLWQISARSDGDLTVQQSQDTYYIRNWSLWLDLYILLATIPAVLGGKGAR